MARKKKTTRSGVRRRQVRERSLSLLYPDYAFCPPTQAQEALGTVRAEELATQYGGELRKADVKLELLVRSEQFHVVDQRHPQGRLWTLSEYMDDWNREIEADRASEEEWDLVQDETRMVEVFHDWHRDKWISVNRDGVIEWDGTI